MGDWVDAKRFFHRDDELPFLEETLRDGTNVLLTGQCRMGKTRLVRELLRDWQRAWLGLPPMRLIEGGR